MQMPKRKAEDDVTEESEEEEIDDLDPSHQDSESSDFEDSGSSEEESDGSEDGSDGETFDSVQVDLDFAQPEEDDFLGIKTVLSNYLDGEEYDSSGLVDLVLKNSTLGTVIRCDDDVIGITTVIPLQSKESTAVHQLEQFICKHLKAPEEKLKVQEAFHERGVGLLLSERLMNCPPAVAPALQSALLEDLEGGQRNNKFKHLILLARAFREGASDDLVYAQPETECFQPYARWVAEFDCPQAEGTVQKGYKRVRLCMLIPFDKLKIAQQDLEKLLSSESG